MRFTSACFDTTLGDISLSSGSRSSQISKAPGGCGCPRMLRARFMSADVMESNFSGVD